MSVLRRITKYFKGAKLLLTDLKMMSLLDIAECGVDSENIPYIQLRSGETFYSFLPKKSERAIYKKYRKTLPNSLIEDSFRVALDIIQRFYRENSGSHIPRKTHHLYPGWGFIDLGAYLGFGAIKAVRKVRVKQAKLSLLRPVLRLTFCWLKTSRQTNLIMWSLFTPPFRIIMVL